MSGFRNDERALSETVGALLLVLIVVAASASLGGFVLKRQDAIQQAKDLAFKADTESIRILSLDPTTDGSGGWDDLNFTIQILSDQPAQLWEVRINNAPVRALTLHRDERGTLESTVWHASGPASHALPAALEAREQLSLNVSTATGFYGAMVIADTESIDIQLSTGYGNVFHRVFIPPTAIAYYEYLSASRMLLDGSYSDHPGDTPIVDWHWVDAGNGIDLHGRRVTFTYAPTTTYNIELTVEDRYGMQATDTLTFTT